MSEPVAFDRESARRIAEAVRRLERMPGFRQEYALPSRRYGSIVDVVEVTNTEPDVNGLCEGSVVIYTTDGDILEEAGEDCLILDVNA